MISKVINGTEQNVAGNGGGTNDYEALTNLPQINGNELIGDQTGADLGLVDAEEGNGIWKTQGEYGVKNLIPYPYDVSSTTHRGITFNANSNGTVSFSGTADNANPAVMQIRGNTASKRLLLKAGTYTVSDGNANDSYGGISLYFYDNNTDNTAYSGTFTGLYTNSTPQVYIWTTQSGSNFAVDSLYGYPKTFTIDSDAYVVVQARSTSNVITTEVSGIIYPMIRVTADTDDTYRPYALSNKQLTDEKSSIKIGVCDTAANVKDKVVTIGDGTSWQPKAGDMVGVKFTNANTYSSSTTNPITLSVNGVKANIWYNTTHSGAGNTGTNVAIYGRAGVYIYYVYDGTYWVWINEGRQDGNNHPSVAVYGNAADSIKNGSCNYYVLTNKSYCHFIFRYANTYNGKLQMNINNTGAKDIYINGEISSSSNKTLPAGTYIAYYENDIWYFRTDGILPAKTTEGAEINERLDATTTAVTGNPISITGLKSNQLAINPIITLEPIQSGSGDPSPSNIRAISGYDKIEILVPRKNLLKNEAEDISRQGYTVTNDSQGAIHFSGTGTNNMLHNIIGLVYAKTDLILSGWAGNWSSPGGVLEARGLDSSGTHVVTYETDSSTGKVILPAFPDGVYQICYSWRAGYDSTGYVMYPMVRVATDTDDTYEPYNPLTNIQLTLGQTIYGGTLDVETGVLTVDRGMNVFGTDTHLSTLNKHTYWTSYPDGNSLPGNIVCDKGSISTFFNDFNGNLILTDESVSSKADMIAKYMPITVVYPLATPYTIQLTPHEISLLKDYAYVSTNGTNMSFSYKNGEIASLADVENLGKTMNLLGNVKIKADGSYTIYQYFNNILIISLHTFTTAKLPIKLFTDGFSGITQLYDVVSHDNVHANIWQDGRIFFNSSQDVTLQSYNIYGTFVVPGVIAE